MPAKSVSWYPCQGHIWHCIIPSIQLRIFVVIVVVVNRKLTYKLQHLQNGLRDHYQIYRYEGTSLY